MTRPARTAVVVTLVAVAGCNPPQASGYRSLTVGNTSTLGSYACVVTDADEVYCWDSRGEPEVYGFMLPTPHAAGTPVRVPDLPPVALVRASNFRTWASTRDAGVYWWGTDPLHPPRAGCSSFCAPRRLEGIGSVSALATSGETACGLVGTEVWCWGKSAYGELGVVPPGAEAALWLPPRRVLSGARDVTMSFGEVCATLLDSTVTCWGNGSPTMTALPVQGVVQYANGCAVNHLGTMWCRDQPNAPRHGVAVLGVREGAFNIGNCIGKTTGEVACWDFNDSSDGGRVIPGILHPLALAVAPFPRGAGRAADEQACALLPGDEVRCWSVDLPDGGSRRVPFP